MTLDEFISWLNEEARKTSQKDLAQRCGVSPSYMGLVLKGAKPPSDKILKALGYEWAIVKKERSHVR